MDLLRVGQRHLFSTYRIHFPDIGCLLLRVRKRNGRTAEKRARSMGVHIRCFATPGIILADKDSRFIGEESPLFRNEQNITFRAVIRDVAKVWGLLKGDIGILKKRCNKFKIIESVRNSTRRSARIWCVKYVAFKSTIGTVRRLYARAASFRANA